jgi:cell division protein FtsQ
MDKNRYTTIIYSGAWLLLVVVLIVSMGFVSNSRKKAKCTDLKISIDSDKGNFFINNEDVREFIYSNIGDPIGQTIKQINLEELEKSLCELKTIRNAEVYADLKGRIKIDIEQRIPIARVFFPDASSSYMDNNGEVMPLSSKYTSRVIVINGQVPYYYLNDEEEIVNPEWTKLFSLVNKIRSDAFFRAQFEQIYINKNMEIELTPRVGRHSILLGKSDDVDRKFKKLKLFYKEGISKVDWNKYKQIDLRFKDQIVCVKR